MDGFKMPVTTSDPFFKLWANAEISNCGTIDAMIDNGIIAVKQSFSSIKLCSKDGEVLASFPVNPAEINNASNLSNEKKEQLKAIAEKFIQNNWHLYVALPDDWANKALDKKNPYLGCGKVPKTSVSIATETTYGVTPAESTPALSALTQSAPAKTTEYPVLNNTEMTKALPFMLREATGLYCPVKGSSPGSRYYLVADFGNVKVAARWAGQMSIRVEWTSISKEQIAALQNLGLSVNSTYASIHLKVGDSTVEGRKTLGSILFAIQAEFGELKSPLPDPTVIRNK